MSPKGWGYTTFGATFVALIAILYLLRVNDVIANKGVLILVYIAGIFIAILLGVIVSARKMNNQNLH